MYRVLAILLLVIQFSFAVHDWRVGRISRMELANLPNVN
jgi:hypothetical protein